MTIFKSFKKFYSFEELFISFFKNDDLFASRENDLVNSLSREFSDYDIITRDAFQELVLLCNETPQVIIDIIRNTFTSEVYTTVLANIKKDVNTITDKMDIISVICVFR